MIITKGGLLVYYEIIITNAIIPRNEIAKTLVERKVFVLVGQINAKYGKIVQFMTQA